MSRIGLVTVVHGRRDHLALQQEALARSTHRGVHRVVVAMDDPGLLAWRPSAGPRPDVVGVAGRGSGLPLAAARNAGARRALARGADLLVFLDVDCLPDPGLVAGYRAAAADPATAGALLCGPVAYLPPPPAGGYDLRSVAGLAEPHPARPAPGPGEVRIGTEHDLFWSLSFAVRAEVWRGLGGFCDRYQGYGGEDTDFGAKARALGVPLAWVGDAPAYHQHHPTADPPRQHFEDIWRNALTFRERWGRWPMTGWLAAFADAGLLRCVEGEYLRPAGTIDAATPGCATG